MTPDEALDAARETFKAARDAYDAALSASLDAALNGYAEAEANPAPLEGEPS